MNWPPIMDRLLHSTEHEAGMRRPAHPPAYDIAGIHVDHEGYVDEPSPRRGIGEVRHPPHVRCRRVNLAADPIMRTRRGPGPDPRVRRLPPDTSLQAHLTHQPYDPPAQNRKPH